MSRYSIKVKGKTIEFKAGSYHEALSKAFRISPFYSDLKRLPSRWWHLVWVALFCLGYYAGLNL